MATTAELLFLDCGEKLEERANWNPEYGKLPDGRYRLIRTVSFASDEGLDIPYVIAGEFVVNRP